MGPSIECRRGRDPSRGASRSSRRGLCRRVAAESRHAGVTAGGRPGSRRCAQLPANPTGPYSSRAASRKSHAREPPGQTVTVDGNRRLDHSTQRLPSRTRFGACRFSKKTGLAAGIGNMSRSWFTLLLGLLLIGAVFLTMDDADSNSSRIMSSLFSLPRRFGTHGDFGEDVLISLPVSPDHQDSIILQNRRYYNLSEDHGRRNKSSSLRMVKGDFPNSYARSNHNIPHYL